MKRAKPLLIKTVALGLSLLVLGGVGVRFYQSTKCDIAAGELMREHSFNNYTGNCIIIMDNGKGLYLHQLRPD